jgi:hypothetical protein
MSGHRHAVWLSPAGYSPDDLDSPIRAIRKVDIRQLLESPDTYGRCLPAINAQLNGRISFAHRERNGLIERPIERGIADT